MTQNESKQFLQLSGFIRRELQDGTPTDNIIRKIGILKKMDLIQKMHDQKRLVATDPLWERVDNKSRLYRFFKRYEKFYYPKRSFFKIFESLPNQQEAKDIFGNVMSDAEVFENKCIRLIENIYSDVKTNKINLPGGAKYYRDTKVIHMPTNLTDGKMSLDIYKFLIQVNTFGYAVPELSVAFASDMLEQYKKLYHNLKILELRKFAQKDIKFKTRSRIYQI